MDSRNPCIRPNLSPLEESCAWTACAGANRRNQRVISLRAMLSAFFFRERSEVEREDADCEASFRLIGGPRSQPPSCPFAGGLLGSSPHLFDWRRKRSALQVANAIKKRAANRRSPIHTCLRRRRATAPRREVTAPELHWRTGHRFPPRGLFLLMLRDNRSSRRYVLSSGNHQVTIVLESHQPSQLTWSLGPQPKKAC